MRARSLFMLCANPDIVVERGEDSSIARARSLTPMPKSEARCSIAASRTRRFNDTTIGGGACSRRRARRRVHRVLAIGNSIRTDLKGAAMFGIDCLFVVSGIHAAESGRGSGRSLRLAR